MTVEELRTRLWARVRPAVESAWPADAAPLAGFQVTLAPDSEAVRVHIAYLSDEGPTLGELGEAAIRGVLRDRLGGTPVELELERLPAGHSVRFPRRLDALAASDRQPLEALAGVMQRFPRLRLGLTAPAASAEGSEANALARRRIESLQKFFAERKIDPSRLETPAAGEGSEDTYVLRLIVPSGT